MGRSPILLPAMVFFVLVPVVLMVAPALEQAGRRLALLAVVLLLTLCVYEWAKTHGSHDRWLCATRHDDMCTSTGDDPGPDWLGRWMVRYFG
jgi:hypothetical protein